MVTSNENIRDALIRHQIGMVRASTTLTNDMVRVLNSSERDLRMRLERRIDQIRARGIDLGPSTTRRLLELEKALSEMLGIPHAEIATGTTAFLTAAAEREVEFVREILVRDIPVTVDFIRPAPALIRSVTRSRPFQGRVLRDWLRTFEAGDRRRIMDQIRDGLLQGQSVQAISRRIFGTQALQGRDGARQITRNGAQALARTATNHILVQARSEFFAANAAVIKFEIYTATLDSRTTIICASLDGKRYPVGKGRFPPVHVNCRSTRVPSVDGSVLGNRPAKPVAERELLDEFTDRRGLRSVRERARLPRGTKGAFDQFKRSQVRARVGPVPATTTFEPWLKTQSRAFQDEVLGPTRAKLFREGKLKLDRFVDQNTGKPYRLDDLMKREPEAFATP